MLIAAAVGLVGCANQSPPPGGPEDRRPPVVVRTEPDTFAVVLNPNQRVRFHFDERISENAADGDMAAAVTVSPLTGDVRVSHGRTSLTVWLEGGFRPGLVYRVTLLPVLSDLFGNRMRDAFEVVFSTGTDLAPTATLAGEVWDRLNGSGINGALVRAVGEDSLVHVARADQSGVFAFRYLPAGDFVLTGFQDTDRDRDVGARESRGATVASLAPGDTLVVDIPLLAPDSTPAISGVATALDSVTLVVEFDDYLNPASPADEIEVQLSREDGDAPLVERLFHEAAYQRYVDQIADSFARLDSLEAAARAQAAAARAAQAVAADSVLDSLGTAPTDPDSSVAAPQIAAPADSLSAAPRVEPRRGPPRLSGTTGPQGAPTGRRTRPGRRIVGLLDGPLEAGAEYRVRVSAVVNINDLPGGGGEVALRFEPPPADTASVGVDADAAAPDSAAIPDSAVVPDTLGIQP